MRRIRESSSTPSVKHDIRKVVVVTKRGSEFTKDETDSMINEIEKCLPLYKEEWDVVLPMHKLRFERKSRTVDGLKRNFSGMHQKHMPTGEHLMKDDLNSPRVLVHPKNRGGKKHEDSSDLFSILKENMELEQQRREEETNEEKKTVQRI